MASLGDVGKALQRALDKIDESMAAHQQAAELAEDARDLLAVAGEGSSQGDVEEARASFTAVVDGIVEPEGQLSGLAHAAGLIREYAKRQGIGEAPAPSSTSPPIAPPAAPSPPVPGSSEYVEHLRKQLPPTVEPGTGQKTHGRWVAAGGVGGEMVSGDGPEADEVARLLREARLPRPGRPFVASHAEMKLAAHMRANGIKNASLVINHVPCKLDFGCETLLPVVLPEGYSLTVYGPNGYQRTFTGGKRTPWQR